MAASTNLEEVHAHSLHNRREIEHSTMCGCFGCLRVFPPSDIEVWIDKGETAICPYCDIDSVIGDASCVDISINTLKALNNKYF